MKLARTWVKGEAPAQMTSFTPPPPNPSQPKTTSSSFSDAQFIDSFLASVNAPRHGGLFTPHPFAGYPSLYRVEAELEELSYPSDSPYTPHACDSFECDACSASDCSLFICRTCNDPSASLICGACQADQIALLPAHPLTIRIPGGRVPLMQRIALSQSRPDLPPGCVNCLAPCEGDICGPCSESQPTYDALDRLRRHHVPVARRKLLQPWLLSQNAKRGLTYADYAAVPSHPTFAVPSPEPCRALLASHIHAFPPAPPLVGVELNPGPPKVNVSSMTRQQLVALLNLAGVDVRDESAAAMAARTFRYSAVSPVDWDAILNATQLTLERMPVDALSAMMNDVSFASGVRTLISSADVAQGARNFLSKCLRAPPVPWSLDETRSAFRHFATVLSEEPADYVSLSFTSEPFTAVPDIPGDQGERSVASAKKSALVGIEQNPGPTSLDRFVWVGNVSTFVELPPLIAVPPITYVEMDLFLSLNTSVLVYVATQPFFTGPHLPANDPDVRIFSLKHGCSIGFETASARDFVYVGLSFAGREFDHSASVQTTVSARSYNALSAPLATRLRNTSDAFFSVGGPAPSGDGLPVCWERELTSRELASLRAVTAPPAPRLVCVETNPGPFSASEGEELPDTYTFMTPELEQTYGADRRLPDCVDEFALPIADALASTQQSSSSSAAPVADVRAARIAAFSEQIFRDIGQGSYKTCYRGRFLALRPVVGLTEEAQKTGFSTWERVSACLQKNLKTERPKIKRSAKANLRPDLESGDFPASAPTASRITHLAETKKLIGELGPSDLCAFIDDCQDGATRAFAVRRLVSLKKKFGLSLASANGKWFISGAQPIFFASLKEIEAFDAAEDLRLLLEELCMTITTSMDDDAFDGWMQALAERHNQDMHAVNGNRCVSTQSLTRVANACSNESILRRGNTRQPRSSDRRRANAGVHSERGNTTRFAPQQPKGVVSRLANAALGSQQAEQSVPKQLLAAAASPIAALADDLINDVPFLGAANQLLGRIEVPDAVKRVAIAAKDAAVSELFGPPTATGPFAQDWDAISAAPDTNGFYNAALSAHGRAASDPMLGQFVGPLGTAVDVFSDLKHSSDYNLPTSLRHGIPMPAKKPRIDVPAPLLVGIEPNPGPIGVLKGLTTHDVSPVSVQAQSGRPFLPALSQAMLDALTVKRPDLPATKTPDTYAMTYVEGTKSTQGATVSAPASIRPHACLGFVNRLTMHQGGNDHEVHVCHPEQPTFASRNAGGLVFTSFVATEEVMTVLRNNIGESAFGYASAPRANVNRISDMLLARYASNLRLDLKTNSADAGACFHKLHEILAISATLGPGGIRGNPFNVAGGVITAHPELPDLPPAEAFPAADNWPSTWRGAFGFLTADSGNVLIAATSNPVDLNIEAFPPQNAGGANFARPAKSFAGALRDRTVAKVFVPADADDVDVWLRVAVVVSGYLQLGSHNALDYTISARGNGAPRNNTHSQYHCTAAGITDDGPTRVLVVAETLSHGYYDYAGNRVALAAQFNAYELVVCGYRRYTYDQIAAAVSRLLSQFRVPPEVFESYSFASWSHVVFSAMPRHNAEEFTSGGNAMTNTDHLPANATVVANYDDHVWTRVGDQLLSPAPVHASQLPLGGAGPLAAIRNGSGNVNTPSLNRPTMLSDWFSLVSIPLFTMKSGAAEQLWAPPDHADYIRRNILAASLANVTIAHARAATSATIQATPQRWRNGLIGAKLTTLAAGKPSYALTYARYLIPAAALYPGCDLENDLSVVSTHVPRPYLALTGALNGTNAGFMLADDTLLQVRPNPENKVSTRRPAVQAGRNIYPIPTGDLDSNHVPDASRVFYDDSFYSLNSIIAPALVGNAVSSLRTYVSQNDAAPIDSKAWIRRLVARDPLPAGAPVDVAPICHFFTKAIIDGARAAPVDATLFPATHGLPAADRLARVEGSSPIHWEGTLRFIAPADAAIVQYDANDQNASSLLARADQSMLSEANAFLQSMSTFSASSSSSAIDATLGSLAAGQPQVDLKKTEIDALIKFGAQAAVATLTPIAYEALTRSFGDRWTYRLATAFHTGRYFTAAESREYCHELTGQFISPDYSPESLIEAYAKESLNAALLNIEAPTRFAEGIHTDPAYANLSRMTIEAASKFSEQYGMPAAAAEWLGSLHQPFQIGLHLAYALNRGARFVIDLLHSLAPEAKPTTEGLMGCFKAIDVVVLKCGAASIGYDGSDADVSNLSVNVGYAPRSAEYVDDISQTANDFFTKVPRPPFFYEAFDTVIREVVSVVVQQTTINRDITTDALIADPTAWLTSGATSELKGPDGEQIRKNAIPALVGPSWVADLFGAVALVATIVGKINEKAKWRRIMPTSVASHASYARFALRTGYMKKYLRAGTSGSSQEQLQQAFARMQALRQGYYGFPIDYPKYDEQQNHEFAKMLWSAIADAYDPIDALAAEYARHAGTIFTEKYVRFPSLTPAEKSAINLDWLGPDAKISLEKRSRAKVGDVDVARVYNGMLSGQSSTTMENTMLGIGYWGVVTATMKNVCSQHFTLGVTNNSQAGDDTDIYVKDPAMAHACYQYLASIFKMRDTDFSCRLDHTVFLKRLYSSFGFKGYPNRALVPWFQRDPLSQLSVTPAGDIAEITDLMERCLRRGTDRQPTEQLMRMKTASVLKSYRIPYSQAVHVLPELGGLGMLPVQPATVPRKQRVTVEKRVLPAPTDYIVSIAEVQRAAIEPGLPLSVYVDQVNTRAQTAIATTGAAKHRKAERAAWAGYAPEVYPLKVKQFDLAPHLDEAVTALELKDPAHLPQPRNVPIVSAEVHTLAVAAFGERGAFQWLRDAGRLPKAANTFPHYSLAMALLTRTISFGPGTSVNSLVSDYLSAWYISVFWYHRVWFNRMSYDACLYAINLAIRNFLAAPRVAAALSAFAE